MAHTSRRWRVVQARARPDPLAAERLKIGDKVWFRHAKAGEPCERFNELHLVDGDAVVATVPTYRGKGQALA
jgi:D-serine deaminase-like pyridoxal phosphate-dependent protein